MKQSAELRTSYYRGLDALLASAKQRAFEESSIAAREVAISGELGLFVTQWLIALSALYDARQLGELLRALPFPTPEVDGGVRLEAMVPAFYAGYLFDEAALDDRGRLAALVSKGLAPPFRRALRDRRLTADQRALVGFHLLSVGLRTWEKSAFDDAIQLLDGASNPTARLWLGLARAGGTAGNGVEIWWSPTRPPMDVTALQDLGNHLPGDLGALALLDAAALACASRNLDRAALDAVSRDVGRAVKSSALGPCAVRVTGGGGTFVQEEPCPIQRLLP
jgi:hypothetical protein